MHRGMGELDGRTPEWLKDGLAQPMGKLDGRAQPMGKLDGLASKKPRRRPRQRPSMEASGGSGGPQAPQNFLIPRIKIKRFPLSG